MLPKKRRSAFSVYRTSSGKSSEEDDQQNHVNNTSERSKTSAEKCNTPWQRSKESPVLATKMTRITSKEQLATVTKSSDRKANKRDSNSGASTDEGSRQHRILSKANKLRRSLHLSAKKKKRSRTESAGNELEVEASEDTDQDLHPSQLEKRRRNQENEIPPRPTRSRTASTRGSSRIAGRRGSANSAPGNKEPEAKPASKRPASSAAAPGLESGKTSLQSDKAISSSSIASTEAKKLCNRPVSTYSCTSLGSAKLPDGAVQQETEAEGLLKWLLSPVKPNKFFSDLWERKPLLIKRHQSTYNNGWFSTKELDEILRQHNVRFSVNLDVTSYKDGKRETHNPVGRAHAPVVWDFYNNGCSVRMLNPQSFSQAVWKLTSLLQEYFGCFVGANTYLTPPGTQGFAPHYDDIEAFIIQLEGKKHWRLYNPRNDSETLPRHSSKNFSPDDIGEPILDTVLEPGDMLYFPRGTIHQGDTPADSHSLHMTLSTYQKNTWGDFLELLVPQALQVAFEEDPELRKGLPLNYLNYAGVANSDSITKERSEFLRKVEKLMTKLISHAPVDAAVDQMAVKVLGDSLPPALTEAERNHSIYSSGASWGDGQVDKSAAIRGETDVRLIRKGVARLVSEEDCVCVYHTMENSRVYHEVEIQRMEFDAEAGPAIEVLFGCFPNYIKVKDLPHDKLDFKVDMVTMLYEKGILATRETLGPAKP